MRKKLHVESIVYSGVLITIGIILPMIFHAVGGAGKVFLPMHIPVILAGFILSPVYAVGVGMLTPLISSLLTTMPLLYPICPIMMVELGTYGLVISLLSKAGVHNIFIKLLASMLVGRLMAGLTVYIMGVTLGLKFDPIEYVKGAIVVGLPGLLIQWLIIPSMVYMMDRYFPRIVNIKR
ncbi:ECF transporter S component [Vallitalea pronyensis]|uniref:ECF transporter S component n=1 Tax=Vallitalea pronyensis TaxID=1348613 RepID=A0A8J8MIC5_9FIRM|nr:ECF transporter S component [Vallitalea pronyensis]QUI22367.1 ECF transporter S component [Vallitalea pronyensis]